MALVIDRRDRGPAAVISHYRRSGNWRSQYRVHGFPVIDGDRYFQDRACVQVKALA